MRPSIVVLALVSWCACFGPATAQQTPVTPAQPSQSTPPPTLIQPLNIQNGIDRLQSEAFNRVLTSQVVAPGRMERAERAAAMINEGKCDEAVLFVRAERDRRLIRRVEEVCQIPN